jgi:hypothetical protein
MRWVDKYKSTNNITLTYDELVKNVKDVLDEIPIHIYKNLKGAYDRSEKYVKKTINQKTKT